MVLHSDSEVCAAPVHGFARAQDSDGFSRVHQMDWVTRVDFGSVVVWLRAASSSPYRHAARRCHSKPVLSFFRWTRVRLSTPVEIHQIARGPCAWFQVPPLATAAVATVAGAILLDPALQGTVSVLASSRLECGSDALSAATATVV